MKTFILILLSMTALMATHPTHAAPTVTITTAVTKKAPPAVDSTQITISLKARHHAFIIALMPSRGQADEIRYITQVAAAIQLNGSGQPADTAQMITVTVTCDLVKRLYLVIGSQQERISSIINDQIKMALFPQLYARPKLLQDIAAIAAQNSQDTDTLVTAGFDFVKAIKQ